MHPVLLGLGTNLGDRVANLKAALICLSRFANITAVSPIYQTEPMYIVNQTSFLNLVLHAETSLAPESLLIIIKQLEQLLGRVPSYRNGPRTIDIDILLYSELVVQRPSLIIPHPAIAERRFVLVPATSIAAGWQLPDGETIAELALKLKSTEDVKFFTDSRYLGLW
jgi:2-amino-4-hydroxy-6-hydroxymethyldihydropteridine diphosphokinase